MTTSQDPARKPLLVIQILLIGALFVVLTLAALREAADSPVDPTATLVPTRPQSTPTTVLTATDTTVPPTATRTSTPTAIPTDTPLPSATPPREPITLTGRGDSVIYPQKWAGPALVRITYGDGGFFTVWTQDQNGERVDQLAQSIGSYKGDSLIDFRNTERTLRFEVRASKDWQIDVLPLSSARHEVIPGTIEGFGDAAIVLRGSHPDLLTIQAGSAAGPFIIYAFGSGRDLVLNTTAPYSGTVAIKADTVALSIKAAGPWHIEITTR